MNSPQQIDESEKDRDTDRDTDRHTAASADATRSACRRLLVIAAAAALAYGISLRGAPYPDQAAAKVLTCGLLALATAHHPNARQRYWLWAALAASACGDALLALPQLPISFVGGLAAFLAAHLAYCALFAPLARRPSGWRRIALPVLWVSACAAYATFLPHLGPLLLPVACYVTALGVMASLALCAATSGPELALGALAFVASDAMIGIDRFIGPFSGGAYAIWFSYAAAQVLIATGILLRSDGRSDTPMRAPNRRRLR